MCAVFLAVIEGVGIGFQRMMADNTRLDVSFGLSTYQKSRESQPLTRLENSFPRLLHPSRRPLHNPFLPSLHDRLFLGGRQATATDLVFISSHILQVFGSGSI